jgi:hypothetical protein
MSDELGMRSLTEAAAFAESKGCRIVYPEPNELFIDIDTYEDWDRFLSHIDKFKDWRWKARPSPSGMPWRKHVVVTLPSPVSERTRIFYQVALGSDIHREMLSWKRLEKGETAPTMFLEKNQ